MQSSTRTRFWLAALGVVLAAVLVATLGVPALAAPPGQGGLPSPTYHPVESVDTTLDVVGGKDETRTFSYDAIDGFELGTTTVRSTYPRGMVFTLSPTSPNGAITDVTLFIRFPTEAGLRASAEWDPETETWVARPWETGDDQPAWSQIRFYWRVRDETDVFVDTPSFNTEYWDPTREWYRLNMPQYLVFWYGGLGDDPQRFADYAAYAIAATHQRRVDGFGQNISYQPVAVIYANRADWSEIQSAGQTNTFAQGSTRNALGICSQFVTGSGDSAIVRIVHVITHELTHMWHGDIVGGANGPIWWYEGLAEWFGTTPPNYDARLVNLATLQDIPSLTTNIGATAVQADGGNALAYSVGPSFVNWVVNTFGIEVIREAITAQAQAIPVREALETASGVSFLELENGWRTYIGLQALTLADVDPASALEPYEDSLFAEGDVVNLPSSPAMVMINEFPGSQRGMPVGSCFGGTEVTLLQIGAIDGVPYFQIDCLGQIGWVARDSVSGS